jgi:hypothetical protein
MKKIFYIIFFLFSFVSSSVSKNQYQPFEIGQILSGKIDYAYDSTFFLPPGEWLVKIVSNSNTIENPKSFGPNTNIYTIGLFQIDKNKKILKKFIELEFSERVQTNWIKPTDCNRENVYIYEKNYGGHTFNCWMVNHRRLSLSHKLNSFEKKLKDLLILENLKIPEIVIYSQHLYASPRNGNIFHKIKYYINPEAEGIEPPVYNDWHTSEYQKIKISLYPKKKQFLDNFVIISANYHKEFQDGLKMYNDEKIQLEKYKTFNK